VRAKHMLVISHRLTAPHSVALQHPWVKNTIWKNFFTKAKGTLAPEKGHFLGFLNTWVGLGPLGPPGSYAPDAKSSNTRPFTDFILRL
jgi:hypothetical protein